MSNLFSQLGIIIAAAGSSSRFGEGNKLFQILAGLPVFCHCLKNFFAAGSPQACLLVTPAGTRLEFQHLLKTHLPELSARVQIIVGAATRHASVLAGLKALPDSCRYVAVQDAARPLSGAGLLRRCLESAQCEGSGVAARRLTDTIKLATANGKVSKTLDRDSLWAAETPQVFQRQLLLDAYQACQNSKTSFTDDAQLLEEAGFPVQLVESMQANPKITFPEDLATLNLEP
jgi:2-C-methyl-D-erythritol 4-phosphate cytidylyltransferase